MDCMDRKFFSLFIRQHLGVLLYALFCVAVSLAVFWLFRMNMAAVCYALILCLAPGAVWLVLRYFRTRQRHRELARLLTSAAQVPPELPAPRTVIEQDYQQLIRRQDAAWRAQETAWTAHLRDQAEYYALWAHQIKTPIAAMNLILQNADAPENRRLALHLNRISQYVDMALALQRLDGGGSDLVIRPCDLDPVVQGAVRRFAGEFIDRKLKLHYAPLNASALTDEKWLGFVLEQLFSNALKYTKTGGITVEMAGPDVLCVRDTGIGIAPEDAPRVFEKGYTGCNGRRDSSASGIGLYLCKRVCDMLGHGIRLESAPGQGTAVYIDLSRKKLEIE